MDFGSYAGKPVALAVDLVNTHDVVDGRDDMPDLASARAFLAKHDVTNALSAADLPRLHALRARLRAVFEAPGDTIAGERINAILVEHHAVPRVSWHGGPLHMHFESATADAVDYVGAAAAMGLAIVLCEYGAERFGVCDRGSCDDVFIDMSKNRTKRFCGDVCAKRESVSAFRARSRAARTG